MTIQQFNDYMDNPSASGGYPIYFICADGGILSEGAAKEQRLQIVDAMADSGTNTQWEVIGCEVNWEDPELFCSHTNERIPSAYAEDSEEQDDETSEGTEVETIRLPAWSMCYLINGDFKTLTDEELKQCQAIEVKYSTIACPDGEPFFSHWNDLDNLGADCFDCPCIKRED